MRIHASFRDDVRLWGSAAGGAAVLFSVIVLLGLGPSPFGSVRAAGADAPHAVVMPRLPEVRGEVTRGRPDTSRVATPGQRSTSKEGAAAAGTRVSGPQSRRIVPRPASPAPTTSRPATPPTAQSLEKPAPLPALSTPPLSVPLPAPPNPPTSVPSTLRPPLPPVTVQSLPQLGNVVPTVPLQ